MKRIKQLVFTLLVATLTLPHIAAAEAWRCGSRLVEVGDAKASVFLKCGEPGWRERSQEERLVKREGIMEGTSFDHETWIYNSGPSEFMRYLYFENGELVRIATGERGFIEGGGVKICRPEELHEGQFIAEVDGRCGEPFFKDSRTEKRTLMISGEKRITTINIDEWTYNFGSQRFMRVLRFENGWLVNIKEIDRGG